MARSPGVRSGRMAGGWRMPIPRTWPVAMHEVLNQAIDDAVVGMRAAHQVSWGQIGRALGITRQAAQQRYSHRSPRSGTRPVPGQLDLWS